MSMLKSYGVWFGLLGVIALSAYVMALKADNNRLMLHLDAANAQIRMYQQAQQFSENASAKLSQHKEATRNEATQQQKQTDDVLSSLSDWADTLIPDDLRRLFNETGATATGAVPPADGAAR